MINVLYVSSHSKSNLIFDNLFIAFNANKSISLTVLCSQPDKFSFLDKIAFKLKIERDSVDINDGIITELGNKNYDLILICKGNNIRVGTLKKIKKNWPNTLLASYSGDNMAKWHNKSIYYHFGFKYYQIIFSVDIPAYKKLDKLYKGTGSIHYLNKAFSKYLHRPLCDTRVSFDYDVIFIGSYEKERFILMKYLAENGVKINVFGNAWDKCKKMKLPENLCISYQPLLGQDYVDAIFRAKITIGFLRKINDDTQTSRTFEIPACGGFMLMQRTDEHLRLFTEGSEAEFFESKEELLKKIVYFLRNIDDRESIAKRGLERCISSKYSLDDTVATMLDIIRKELH